MIEDILAARYAKAITNIAAEKEILDRVHAEVELLADVLLPNRGAISVPELITFLGMPRVPLEQKIRVTDIMLEKLNFTEEVGNLLNVLISKQRIGIIGRIADHVRRRTASLKGVVGVAVDTARPLSDKDRSTLKSALESALGKEVDITVREDATLLGGLCVHLGDTMIDGSVSGRLERLETALKE